MCWTVGVKGNPQWRMCFKPWPCIECTQWTEYVTYFQQSVFVCSCWRDTYVWTWCLSELTSDFCIQENPSGTTEALKIDQVKLFKKLSSQPTTIFRSCINSLKKNQEKKSSIQCWIEIVRGLKTMGPGYEKKNNESLFQFKHQLVKSN